GDAAARILCDLRSLEYSFVGFSDNLPQAGCKYFAGPTHFISQSAIRGAANDRTLDQMAMAATNFFLHLPLSPVMAGHVPAIHVDPRDEPADDEKRDQP